MWRESGRGDGLGVGRGGEGGRIREGQCQEMRWERYTKPDHERHLCHIKEFEYYLEDNREIINEF